MPQATPRAVKGRFGTQPAKSNAPGGISDDGATSGDGTRQLLEAGFGILAVGFAAALLTKTVFGGIGEHGPHTNSGWIALIAAMMCLPFGLMLTVLGSAKWLRNRQIAKAELAKRNR
jgi:hypothetical protein